MGNLYIFVKLLYFSHTFLSHLVHGVARQGGQGVPDCVKQSEHTRHKDAFNIRGTLKAAIIWSVPDLTPIVCTSLYNVKPFYMMSTVAPDATWHKRSMEIFCTFFDKKVQVPFYRLNMANIYNNNMGEVDVGDQLRLVYHFDYWLHNRKWWWSVWFWNMGMLITNSYILYTKFYKMHGRDPKYSHYKYCCQVVMAWINPKAYNWKKSCKKPESQAISTPQGSLGTTTQEAGSVTQNIWQQLIADELPAEKIGRKTRVNDNSLHPDTRSLRIRLKGHLEHWFVKSSTKTAA
mmetsp:Transcript_24190/g.55012  ORF Transcript_24190/g.55012 Transcript_24190/m.55012 type:complete len:290 (-) Transcript_24190:221-1090(-)